MPKSQTNHASETQGRDAAQPSNWLILLIVVVAFAVRLGMAVHEGISRPPSPGTDQEEYDTYAWNLARGRGYRGMSPDVADQDHLTAYRPPGPALLFAAVYLIAGHSFAAARIVNCTVAAICVLWTYRLGKRAYSPLVGILAAGVYAVFPVAIVQSTDLLSEPLGVLLFLVFLDYALAFAAQPSWRLTIASGIFFGLALLARANYVVMVPMLVLWASWQFRGSSRALVQSLAMILVAGIVVSPWAIRNYLVFGKVIPFSTMGGSVLLQGNNRVVATEPTLYGYSVWDTEIPEYRDALRAVGDEYGRDELAKKFAINWIRDNRAALPRMMWNKFTRAWTPFLTNNPSWLQRTVYLMSWGPILTLFSIALIPTLVQSFRSRSGQWLLHMAILHYVINSVVFFANIRYRAPIDPLCLLLAAWTVSQMVSVVCARCVSRFTSKHSGATA